jgi:hypothetical protein
MAMIRRLFALLALTGAAACGDDDNLPDPADSNGVDTVTVGSLTDTPITTPSGFAVLGGEVRTDETPDFDFAYDIQGTPDTGHSVMLPRAALGIPSSSGVEPGVMRVDQAFDDILVAPSNGYVTEEAVPVVVGERYVVRSRVICNIGVPQYAKIEVISLENNSLVLKVLANNNCGYRGLEPGLPDR